MKIAPFKDQTNKNRSNTNTKNNFRLEAILPSTKDHNPKHFKEENRANGSKSFMIRKKNISTYCKRLDDQKGKGDQDLHDRPKFVIQQIFFDNQSLREKLKQQQRSNNVDQFKQLGKQLLQTSSLNSSNGIKIKPVICRQAKKGSKFKEVIQSEMLQQNKVSQKSDFTHYVQQMIRKISKSSKSSIENKQPSNKNEVVPQILIKMEKRQARSKQIYNAQQKQSLLEEKIKMFNGCKTIRIPWGVIQGHSHDIIHKKAKLQQQFKGSSHKEVQVVTDCIFGGISGIQSIQLGSKINQQTPVESLRQLFNEFGCTGTVQVKSRQQIDN